MPSGFIMCRTGYGLAGVGWQHTLYCMRVSPRRCGGPGGRGWAGRNVVRVAAQETTRPPSGAALQEALRRALEAEAEEDRRGVAQEVSRSSMGVEDLRIVGRMYSEILWAVEISSEGGRSLRGLDRRKGSGVVFDCGRGKYLEGSLVDVEAGGGRGLRFLVAVRKEDSTVLSAYAAGSGNEGNAGDLGGIRGRGGLGVVVGAKLNSASLERQLKAVERLSSKMEGDRKGARVVRAIILGSAKASSLAGTAPEWMASPSAVEAARGALAQLQNLNPSQKAAIVKGLTQRMTLWQGPPGTGKTRTLLGLTYVLSMLLRAQRVQIGKVLAIAETNAAADNLLAGMDMLGISCVRVGPVSRVRSDLHHRCLDALAEQSPAGKRAAKMRDMSTSLAKEAKTLRDSGVLGSLTKAQGLEFESQRLWKQSSVEMAASLDAVMRDADVIVATCVSAGDGRLEEQQFRVVLVDEATQATQPSTLIALTRGTECVIMAGDDMQLPPTVVSNKAQQLGLGVSLFERMRAVGLQPELLDEQYRMHPDISSFSSRVFYDGRLRTSVSASARPPVQSLGVYREMRKDHENIKDTEGLQEDVGDHGPVTFIACSGRERRCRTGRQGHSYANESQVEMVLELIDLLIKNIERDNIKSCAVLTPYNGQLDLLRKAMEERGVERVAPGWLTLSTVDGFQGREADVVIFSTVRSNDEGKLGFVRDPRRMNVAITRAKRGLVVIGDDHTLAADPLWATWLAAHAPRK